MRKPFWRTTLCLLCRSRFQEICVHSGFQVARPRWSSLRNSRYSRQSMKRLIPAAVAFANTTVALLWSLASAGAQTPSHPPNAVSPGRSHLASFGTNKVHYIVEGKGSRTILLVHCWAGNSGFWREQVPALAGRARLILGDLPGHGQR